MNIRTTLTILLTLICLESYSQSIFSLLRLEEDIEIKSDSPVKEIILSTTFYDKRDTKTKKDIIVLNEKNKIVSQLHYLEDETLGTQVSRTFDASGARLLTVKNERWHPVLGNTSETATYAYDQNGHIIKITVVNQNNEAIRETIAKNNAKGHPIELLLNIGNPNPYVTETATYDYSNNRATIKFHDDQGNVIAESQTEIDLSIKDFKKSKYDSEGNLLMSGKYSYTYKFDKKQNWITKTVYTRQKKKQQKYQELTRKIKYE